MVILVIQRLSRQNNDERVNIRIFMKQIVGIAGARCSTVDKVLHNGDGISSKEGEKVKEIIGEVGYKLALTKQKESL
ncbi:MAG TPA: LacI family DNA-binding transcriptional regulator [Clostridiales bacterium]|nr:LacI family DNA-binding transcriptional regulator [Clostridiales bacterium]